MDDHADREESVVNAARSYRFENTTDAMRGQPLGARVLARKDELETALADLGPYDSLLREAIETALATIYSLMTGDLAHPSRVIGRDLSRWLERNKHLAQDVTRIHRRDRR